MSVSFPIELDREEDGRWIAEIPDLPGVLCYGASRDEAIARIQALALRVLA
jgi:predicted RNase H-like HicB family nuclease